jgi:hypothetical protein
MDGMDSISLLLNPPKSRAQGAPEKAEANDTEDSKAVDAGSAKDTQRKDQAELEAFTRAIVDAINRRDWESNVFALPRHEFYASPLDIFPETHTWAEHLGTFKTIARESPEYHMGIKQLHVDVQSGRKTAKVYLTAEISGRPPEIKRESLGVLHWQRFAEGWRQTAHINMRQSLSYSGGSWRPS